MRFDTQQLVLNYHLILSGLEVTIVITVLSLAFGIVIGLVLCLGKLRDRGVVYRVSVGIIDFFRTIPEVVLIFWVYSCLPLLLSLRISAEASGVIALSLFAAAYLAEIFRAGVLAVPRGQVEAALALGIPAFHIWSRVIFPPAIRSMMPAFVSFLTDYDRQMVEARKGLLPTRAQVWDDAKAEFRANGDDFLVTVFETYQASMAEDAFTPPLIPEWIEVSNVLWPQLQAAMIGDKSAQDALDEAAADARIVMEDAGYL